jgi:hypothetical protein
MAFPFSLQMAAAVALLVGIVLGLVFGILYLVSRLVGWGALARTYDSGETVFRGALLEQSNPWVVWVGAMQYRNLVHISCYERGIELRASFPFQRSLFIPWEDVYDYGPSRTLRIFGQAYGFFVDGRRIRFTGQMTAFEQKLTENQRRQ